MVESNNQPKESLKKLSKDFNQNPYKSYQYPKEDKEILAKMRHPNYEGFNMALPSDATLLDRTKYLICKQILNYEYDSKLTTEELAKQINLSVPETKEILLCHINRFTLDRLLTCFDNLHLPLKVKITNQPEY
ncbi:MAG: hypothetical protein I3273_02855 [Candidatus Moeniiplasma glomeromycotorum]|nr:hypothetical protein [Candidatus Moeniiplasma glomeromycotorum]MCE8167605.1 hypothetical protein [Candidatus Moeniiplasma glomeromycotorum]MCE8169045.1 hypothetical protein [Candidatus Moeniiplasma glomeromycotorum]